MVSQLSFPSVFALCAVFIAVTSAQQCYGLDGRLLDNTYAPCNPGAKHSGCCATKRTNQSPDICLDNGLCMTTTSEELGMLWQNGCTDETGRDIACPKMCSDASNKADGLMSVVAWQIQTCNYGMYCCRAAGDRRSCCDDASAPKINTNSIGALQVPMDTTTTTKPNTNESAHVITSSTGTPLTATAASDIDSCEKERHKVTVIGGTLGGLLAAAILASSGAIYWMYTRERRQRRLKQHYEKQFSQTNAYRKALASTVSLRASLSMEDLQSKSNGV